MPVWCDIVYLTGQSDVQRNQNWEAGSAGLHRRQTPPKVFRQNHVTTCLVQWFTLLRQGMGYDEKNV